VVKIIEKLKKKISVLLYKMEKTFPPSFFNPMPAHFYADNSGEDVRLEEGE
jgi:hypothetical protein